MYSVTEETVKWLTGLGYKASTYPSEGLEFVTVERTGGTVDDLVDHPSVAIQTWATTEERAEEMAILIRNEALTSSTPYGVATMRVNAGPYPFWDEYTKSPRYQIVFDCSAQLTN